ncbi:MAG: hypothetical protein HZT40_06325 [Candidatus Thiothrix singaporensis]|uniref:Uncharacterized protein n=1 Tax=Candidatus Thiothrix singaporensis TaxID=2799669 RepID=A0A7L6AQB7_9GAMM|nr:MAG: hypothetical protein HZT40_06325 [Candidatus Thiothrix singaporensis]
MAQATQKSAKTLPSAPAQQPAGNKPGKLQQTTQVFQDLKSALIGNERQELQDNLDPNLQGMDEVQNGGMAAICCSPLVR